MDIVGAKVLVIFLLGSLKLGCGLLPLVLTKYLTRKRKLKCLEKFIGMVLCLGGGILLSTVFIHMIKEVRESLDAATQKGVFKEKDLDFPFAELLICMGFMLIFLVESVVHKFFGHHGHGHGHGPPTLPALREETEMPTKQAVPAQLASGVDNQAYENDSPRSNDLKLKAAPLSSEHPDTTISAKPSPFTGKKIGRNVYNVSSATLTSYTSFDSGICLDTTTEPQPSSLDRGRSASSNSIAREKSFVASVRGFLIVLALSIHSLFEGMAIGLEETQGGVWKLFAAVIIHAVAIVFCIGTEMIASGLKKKTIIIYMLVLGVNSPVGVLIGLIVTLQVETASGGHLLAVGVLQGLAAGTLLYITFFEVLSREKLAKYRMTGILGAVAIMVGFAIMATMEGTGSHSHSHGGPVQGRAGHGHAHAHAHELDDLMPRKIGSEEQDNFDFNPFEHSQYHGGRINLTEKDHNHDHDHGNFHGDDHGHDHYHETDEDPGEEIGHGHDHDHGLDIEHGHDHEHGHEHDNDHGNDHDHDHGNGHDHDHDNDHDHDDHHNESVKESRMLAGNDKEVVQLHNISVETDHDHHHGHGHEHDLEDHVHDDHDHHQAPNVTFVTNNTLPDSSPTDDHTNDENDDDHDNNADHDHHHDEHEDHEHHDAHHDDYDDSINVSDLLDNLPRDFNASESNFNDTHS